MHTVPLYELFCKSGIASVCGDEGRLAVSILKNHGSINPVSEYDSFQAFFDMEYVSSAGKPIYAYNECLESLVQKFPDAVYLFNTGYLDSWLERRKSLYGYLPKAKKYFGIKESAIIDLWAEHYFSHTTLVESLLKSKRRFFRYNVDIDRIEHLCEFMELFGFKMNVDAYKVCPEVRGSTDRRIHINNLRESALFFYYHLDSVENAIKILEVAQELQPCSSYYKDELEKWKSQMK